MSDLSRDDLGIPPRANPGRYWREVERALEWYASDANIEAGIYGHWNEDREEWVPDEGHRACVVLHGNPFPSDVEVEADRA